MDYIIKRGREKHGETKHSVEDETLCVCGLLWLGVGARAHGAASRHGPPETRRIFVATEVLLGNPISGSADSREI